MRKVIYMVMALVGLLAGSVVPGAMGAEGATSNPSARRVVEGALHDVMAVLQDKGLAPAEKRHKVRDIAYEYMDFETLSRLSLGRNWRELSASQREDFIKEFKIHMSVTYGESVDRYQDQQIAVNGDRKESNGDWTVQTTIGKAGGGSRDQVKVDYRLRQKDNQWKVMDVTIDGVSMVANFRSQFQEIMGNGGFANLLKMLREKNAAAEK